VPHKGNTTVHLNSYLSLSRHGIFYFRWPMPKTAQSRHRASSRLSLGTRCPKRARQLARHLASCGDTLRHKDRIGPRSCSV